MKNNKSGENMALNKVIGFIIVILVMVSIIFVIRTLFFKQTVYAGGIIDELGDYDGDGIPNNFDDCKCEYFKTDNGCKIDTDVDKPGHCQYKTCDPSIVPKWAQTNKCP